MRRAGHGLLVYEIPKIDDFLDVFGRGREFEPGGSLTGPRLGAVALLSSSETQVLVTEFSSAFNGDKDETIGRLPSLFEGTLSATNGSGKPGSLQVRRRALRVLFESSENLCVAGVSMPLHGGLEPVIEGTDILVNGTYYKCVYRPGPGMRPRSADELAELFGQRCLQELRFSTAVGPTLRKALGKLEDDHWSPGILKQRFQHEQSEAEVLRKVLEVIG